MYEDLNLGIYFGIFFGIFFRFFGFFCIGFWEFFGTSGLFLGGFCKFLWDFETFSDFGTVLRVFGFFRFFLVFLYRISGFFFEIL